ncbi:MAG: OadG family protein [Clostridiales bacterium]|nr:OadG family protein [Clostridiales bacterium]
MKRTKKWFFGLFSAVSVLLFPLTAYAAEETETMGEKMTTAVFNTILGIGTVFIMLIVISLIIYCFRFIPGIVERSTKKKKELPQPEAPVAKKPAPKPVVAAAAPAAAVQTDDTELIAVIAAAIAASEQIPLDGFIVRTIRKRA